MRPCIRGGVPSVDAAANIYVDIDSNTQVIMERGRVLVKSYVHNYGDRGATVTRVKMNLWIEYGRHTYSYSDKSFYPQGLYVSAGQKVWHTFYFYAPSIPKIGIVASRLNAVTWFK